MRVEGIGVIAACKGADESHGGAKTTVRLRTERRAAADALCAVCGGAAVRRC